MKTTPHASAIVAAARRHLVPLGVKQRGRSRFWQDDRGWFLIGVEFQPSSFAKGSYLNVGCCWLWHVQPHFSFDLGHREEGFYRFTSSSEWEPIAERLAQRASELVQDYRLRFRSPTDLAAHYERHDPATFWDRYHAAIACGLTNQIGRAQALFRTAAAEASPTSPQWLKDGAERCVALNADLADPIEFRRAIEAEVERGRSLMKLPEVHAPLAA